jgi:hypothetical protein
MEQNRKRPKCGHGSRSIPECIGVELRPIVWICAVTKENLREGDLAGMIFHGRFFEFSPVPKCEVSGAPAMWLEQNPETGATRQPSALKLSYAHEVTFAPTLRRLGRLYT